MQIWTSNSEMNSARQELSSLLGLEPPCPKVSKLYRSEQVTYRPIEKVNEIPKAWAKNFDLLQFFYIAYKNPDTAYWSDRDVREYSMYAFPKT